MTEPPHGGIVHAVHGARVVFDAISVFDDADEDGVVPTSVAIYDLVARRYATAWPRDLPYVTVYGDQPEDLRARRSAHRRRSRVAVARQRSTGAARVVARRALRLARRRGRRRHRRGRDLDPAGRAARDTADDSREEGRGRAIGLTPSGDWRVVFGDGTVGDGTRTLARLDAADAFAVSPDGSRIAALRGGDVTIYDVSGARVSAFTLA